ncbi:MAG: hypothetical protein CML06_21050 [Pseudomonadales bacterium]|nr:hypothetical protein [Pseudomonadales bacterium]
MTIYRPEAEQSVIGGLLLEPAKFDEVADVLRPGDFYNREYKAIFSAMAQVMDDGEFPEWQLVADKLDQTSPGSEWFVVLAKLQKEAPSARNIVTYAGMVAEDARRRQLYLTAPQIQGLASDRSLSIEKIVNQAHGIVERIESDRGGEGPVMASEKLKGFVDHMDVCFQAGDGITGLRTGFGNMDSRLGGLKPGELTVIAARPSMGKTSFALNIATQIAVSQGLPVLFFTIEMDSNQIIGRTMSNIGSIPYSRVVNARLSDSDWANMAKSVQSLNQCSLLIDDSSSLHIQEAISRSRRCHRKTPLALIVVDHIGLVDAEGENETVKVGRVSRGLKRLAKKIGVPVLALSQLSR